MQRLRVTVSRNHEWAQPLQGFRFLGRSGWCRSPRYKATAILLSAGRVWVAANPSGRWPPAECRASVWLREGAVAPVLHATAIIATTVKQATVAVPSWRGATRRQPDGSEIFLRMHPASFWSSSSMRAFSHSSRNATCMRSSPLSTSRSTHCPLGLAARRSA